MFADPAEAVIFRRLWARRKAELRLELSHQMNHQVNRRVLDRRPGLSGSVERLLQADRTARDLARSEIEALCVS